MSMTVMSGGFGIEAHAQQRSIINPSFEEGPTLPNNNSFIITDDSNVTGWRSQAADGTSDIEIWEDGFQDRDAFDGQYLVELNPRTNVGLFQEICLINNEPLTWTFSHAARNGNVDPQTTVLEIVSTDGLTTHQFLDSSSVSPSRSSGNGFNNLNPWAVNSDNAIYAGPTGIQRLQFRSTNAGSTGNFLDAIQVPLVPIAQFASNSTSVAEDSTTQLPQVVVAGLVVSDIRIQIDVDPSSTAVGGGEDYTQTAAFLTIPAGNYDAALASSRFDVPFTITVDPSIEPDETLVLNFGSITDTAGNPVTSLALGDVSCTGAPVLSQSTHTIENDDEAAIELVKSVSSVDDTNGNGVFGDFGDTVNFVFTAENTGGSALAGISVTDDGFAGLTGASNLVQPAAGFDGDLAIGEGPVQVATATYVLAQDDVAAGSVSNTATVTSTPVATTAGGDPDPSTPLTDAGGANLPAATDTSDTGTEPDFNSTNGTTTPVSDPSAADTDGTAGNDGDEPTVLTLPAPNPSVELVKSVSSIDDTNGNGMFGDVGDTVNFVFTAENTGNTALAGISVSDDGFAALTGASNLSQPATGFDGDLAIGEGPVQVATATYILAPADIAAGTISNTATASATAVATGVGGVPDPLTPLPGVGGANLPAVTDTSDAGSEPAFNSTNGTPTSVSDPSGTNTDGTAGNDGDEPTVLTLPILVPAIELIKSVANIDDTNGNGVHGDAGDTINFVFTARNTGNAALAGISVTDDGFAALTGASNLVQPTAGFDGDLAISEGPVEVATATYVLTATDEEAGFVSNSASATSTAVASALDGTPIPASPIVGQPPVTDTSDAGSEPALNVVNGAVVGVANPAITNSDGITGNDGDEPTVVSLLDDPDGDGSPTGFESATADRDGDGIPDASDYDPTGYFYCQDTSAILTGGLISVTGPAGTQTGVGVSNNISIIEDGSNGFYQFTVSAAGRYTLNVTYPTTGVPSADRLPSPVVDATSFLPANPAVLGSGEVAATGVLADGSAAANPFHFQFDIAPGDPNIFNNNIPLQFCGVPEVSATKTLVGRPVLLPNRDGELTFRITGESTGSTQVNDVTLIDDLDSVFGAGNYSVVSTTLFEAPSTFGATANSRFNGSTDQRLLTNGGILQPGEIVSVDLRVQVDAAVAGDFVNIGQAGGASPLDGSAIPNASGNANVTLPVDSDRALLIVEKTAARNIVRLGEILPYTVVVINPDTLDVSGIDVVDTLPPGLTYRPGSAQIEGVATEPLSTGRRLVFPNQNIAANSRVTYTFNVAISAAATAVEFENLATAEDPTTGARISNVGIAIVTREVEHVFDCGEIIGRVFDDKNKNKHHDEGEKGLAGVRLATVRGELITTDKFGRFHVPCASIPDADIGSNFILKLDERTLPTGYHIVTENPRVVRLTRGKLTKLNFGASLLRVVRINLNANAFNGGKPSRALKKAIPKIIATLNKGKSVLRLDYWESGEGKKIGRERTRALSKMIKKRWKRAGDYKLDIDARVLAK
ncbi:MAG: hypothetical protein ABJK39_08680 [Hyphomicrobiales bacterium]